MTLPFTAGEFLDVFERLNVAIFPVQLLAYALAAGALVLVLAAPGRVADRVAGAVLAAMWAFTGAVYFLGFFRATSGIALPAGVLFLGEAALIAWAAARGRLRFGGASPRRTELGGLLVLYAAIAYPLVGAAAGHAFPRAPAFGLTPCPLVIFTWGMLVLAAGRVPPWLLPIPALWSLVGTSAAWRLGMVEDWGLPISATLALLALAVPRQPPLPREHRVARAA